MNLLTSLSLHIVQLCCFVYSSLYLSSLSPLAPSCPLLTTFPFSLIAAVLAFWVYVSFSYCHPGEREGRWRALSASLSKIDLSEWVSGTANWAKSPQEHRAAPIKLQKRMLIAISVLLYHLCTPSLPFSVFFISRSLLIVFAVTF